MTNGSIPDYASGTKLAGLKYTLVRLGQALPGAFPLHLQAALNYLLLGHWLRSHGFNPEYRAADRPGVFAHMAKRLGNKPLLYLEFGVFQGASIERWSKLLTNPECRFIGFDSFRGMGEDFDERTGIIKGAFDLHGSTPKINDSRVSFVPGWFEDSLPGFTVPPHDQLVVHVDCDVYSATVLVFKKVGPFIKPGTVMIFDDMGQPTHEPRAFTEYMRDSGRRFKLIAADRQDHYAFECVG